MIKCCIVYTYNSFTVPTWYQNATPKPDRIKLNIEIFIFFIDHQNENSFNKVKCQIAVISGKEYDTCQIQNIVQTTE